MSQEQPTLFELVTELSQYKSKAIPLKKAFDYYDFFERLFGIWHPMRETVIRNVYDRIKLVERKTGTDSQISEADFKKVIHSTMEQLEYLIDHKSMQVYQLSYLLEPPSTINPTFESKTGPFGAGVIERAIELNPENKAYYRTIAQKATKRRLAIARKQLKNLNYQLQNGFSTIEKFNQNNRFYQTVIKIVGVGEDTELIAQVKRKTNNRHINNVINTLNNNDIKPEDYTNCYIKTTRPRYDTVRMDYYNEESEEKIGVRYLPFEQIIDLLRNSLKTIEKDSKKEAIFDIDKDILQKIFDYKLKVVEFYTALNKTDPLVISQNNALFYQTLKRTWEYQGIISNVSKE